MSDGSLVDVGDEVVVSISGYPVGKGRVYHVGEHVCVEIMDAEGGWANFNLPLDFKEYERVDGYGHHSQPLTGIGETQL